MIHPKGIPRLAAIMYRAIHIFVAFAMLVHVVLGCCMHHAHANGGSNGDETFVVETSCSCRQHAGGEVGEPSGHRSQGGECNHEHCVLTRSESVDSPEMPLAQDHFAPTGVFLVVSTLRAIDAADSTLRNSASPIPMHLLNQAFLL